MEQPCILTKAFNPFLTIGLKFKAKKLSVHRLLKGLMPWYQKSKRPRKELKKMCQRMFKLPKMKEQFDEKSL